MSVKYDEYIVGHKTNVTKAYDWLCKNLPEIFQSEYEKSLVEWQCTNAHDQSKYNKEEYEAYDNYFYGNRSYETVKEFRYAWLHHIHNNPHHWQYWVLINDEPGEGWICLEIPDEYIIEMICDWWSFSWKSGNLQEIFEWYDNHKDYMKINGNSRARIEQILDLIKERL